jgi:phosphotransferase system  glucose/maltose/N-acetylglucosamine-specific IIC component
MEALNQFLFNIVQFIVQPAIWLLFALAMYYFVSGMIPFLLKADDAKEREKGRQYILWAIVGFFIMVSVFGLLQVLTNTFDIQLPEGPVGR